MKSHLQPRTLLVQRREQSFCALFFSDHEMHPATMPPPRKYPLVSERIGSQGTLATNQNQLRRIQIP